MTIQATKRAYTLGAEEGEAIWFAGTLTVLKAKGDQTQGRFALLDQLVPGDYAVPRHLHHDEDEAWYLLDGEATFYCGDEQFHVGRGGWVFLPQGVPHAFRAGPAGARLLVFSAPARFADFVCAAGEPAPSPTLPPPAPLDVERLAALASRYGIEILGPPPT
ncbi:MAG TPA: cupin domain-containing protein [Caldilineaceae bacterium]|nr:cupin domain-containing protein [Caldilineaceae bacterium]